MNSGGPPSPAPAHRSHPESRSDPSFEFETQANRALIELTVEKPQHLFHAFDPSPIAGRELDERVVGFIVHSAEDVPESEYRLIIHVPAQVSPTDSDGLANAVRTHFGHQYEIVTRKRRAMMREGRQALAIGIGFLFACGLAGHFAMKALPPPFGLFVEQGLMIVGWVANWRPIEIFLYDWRPLARSQRLFGALARMPVEFRPLPPETVQGHG